ncbi:hypothetical protein [Sphingobacterium deserti]|uniref:Uncharacterized protein n=1 Tax=Sphingobacterium deserti TaxID=1229276 RepID=A0A0B8T1X5_9SPHI|nr:hypothetical protein [Sphingobacterium deserti]KGE14766.1 hypothetical protein DI53_1440 [Sphingobacterium deserti]
MKVLQWYILPVFFLFGCQLFAQETEGNKVSDDIQIDVKSVNLNAETDTLTVELFLISYQMDQREFKLNTYATQVLDEKGEQHLYTLMKMGRVTINIADKQNYLHYLFEENVPVPLTIKYADWTGEKPKKLLLVFEDSGEDGKFITQEVEL